jgi:DNA-binding HxlR family transcriptional regulator
MGELEVFGAQCLDLLGDEAMVTVLSQLRLKALSAMQMEQAVPGLSYKVALSRLRRLVSLGLVAATGQALGGGRSSGRVAHRLITPGSAILTVVGCAANCEATWGRRPRPFAPLGAQALAVAADRSWRAIARALAHERLRVRDLEALIPEISHGTLERRLRDREAQGLIKSQREGREAWHSLTDSARRQATVAMYAGRWEWIFGDADKGLLASDLAGVIHQLAPLVRLPDQLNGICRMREDWHTTLQSDVYLAVRAGELIPFVVGPLGQPDVTAKGTPQEWAQALITDDVRTIVSTGDGELLAAVIAGLHHELCAASNRREPSINWD